MKRFMVNHRIKQVRLLQIAIAFLCMVLMNSCSPAGTTFLNTDTMAHAFSQAITLTLETPLSGSVDSAGNAVVYQFTPPSTGAYTIASTGDYTTYGYLYDENQALMDSSDERADGNFGITSTLAHGQVYYIVAKMGHPTQTGDFQILVSLIEQETTGRATEVPSATTLTTTTTTVSTTSQATTTLTTKSTAAIRSTTTTKRSTTRSTSVTTATTANTQSITVSTRPASTGVGESAPLTLLQQQILDRAKAMVEFKWTPKQDLMGWLNKSDNGVMEPESKRTIFRAGVEYTGIPYSMTMYQTTLHTFQNNLNKADFYDVYKEPLVDNRIMPKYGNDCSGFVSYAWGVKRLTTYGIIDSPLTKHFAKGYTDLKPGDAFVKRGHTFLYAYTNAQGNYVCYEQSPPIAKVSIWTPKDIVSNGYIVYRLVAMDG